MANYSKPFPMWADATPTLNPWQAKPSLFTVDAPFHMPAIPWAQGYGPSDLTCYALPLPFVPHREPKIDPKLGSLSPMGVKFIYRQESLVGVTNHLHWPGGASGITLGPGYDMKARSAAQITADMKAIGLPDAAIEIVAKAAGMAAGANHLDSNAMKKFAKDHRKDVDLNDQQQMGLLKHIAVHYEGMVRRALKVPLAQHEFDALVSYAYNPGGGWQHATRFINAGKVAEAMQVIRSCNRSKGAVMKGLTLRRADEVKLFMEGKYEFHGHPIA
jgi:GH24 family phage-related lysozyme (muramidase)